MKVNRRDFLTFAGFTAAGVTLGRLGRDRILARETFKGSSGDGPGVEQWTRSVCGQCPAGCGVQVRLVDGRPVKIEGNALCPVSRGRLCPKGAAGLQALYDPDRLVGPVRRVGPRGSGRWERIDWGEAVRAVATRLSALRQQGRPQGLVYLTGRQPGMMGQALRRFCEAYGSPNLLEAPDLYDEASALVAWVTQGVAAPFGYDLEQTNYLLSFGSPILEAWRSPVWANRAYGRLRRGRPGRRGRFVQVESRLSPTAAKADEWVPIHPGTEAALALGIAHVLVREGRYDEAFVRDRTFGFDDWTDEAGQRHIGFRTLVLSDYDPEAVSAITGVPGVTILRLAREFSAVRPAVAIGEGGVLSRDAYSQFAVHCLNALVGCLGSPGGVVIQQSPPLQPLPPVERDEGARLGLSRPRIDGADPSLWPVTPASLPALAEAILDGRPYPVEALLLDGSAPLRACPAWGRLEQALGKVPFVVSFSPYLDERGAFADLILPDHTPLEKWQDAVPTPWAGPPAVGVGQPALPPLLDTRHTGEVVAEIARGIGGGVAAAFPYQDYREVILHGLRGLYDAQRGMAYSPPFESAWISQLEHGGWWAPGAGSFEEFWAQVVDRGGWWDPAPTHGSGHLRFETPSGRFEFFSQTLRGALAKRTGGAEAALVGLFEEDRLHARGDRAYLPYYEPVPWVGEERDYPLFLNVFEVPALGGARDSNQPFLLEILGPHLQARWETWAEIHPATAKAQGIAEGDRVWVESPLGRVQARARLYAGAMQNVVSLPLGLGAPGGGRWSRGRGANPARILAASRAPFVGIPTGWTTRVKLERASHA
ncbi:MAG: hypothetical protein A3F84_10985 [Candidatus Handelsmanbacteria bacterium RIFCSPLOWO2_12_FULL_64_10]|uniref:4Fe-4S Mo/W bis-MGD-type domain-containing protein n=1 Tax=Handelsmanbacteria sp. (strain RIFCSPLOWO2_12_FULL_64_10) TaxID=1817868 RepID=A0A1F6CZ74_HANXR|nr:MAG: hypothetical protein A3F84_10985 [Candidatus Handelsmanbacteria bacterium RIFCSPLOWO2_12_FULL_64_10]